MNNIVEMIYITFEEFNKRHKYNPTIYVDFINDINETLYNITIEDATKENLENIIDNINKNIENIYIEVEEIFIE